MICQGSSLSVSPPDNGIAELVFDAAGSVNKFDQATLRELVEATAALHQASDVRALVIRSAKSAFVVGADITEFTATFAHPEDEVLKWVAEASHIFNGVEDLPFPTVVALTGFALGGGCEMALSCDLRIADTTTRIGLPEVKLGIMPGFGGTVRLPRVIGSDNALMWMTTGKDRSAAQALAEGAVDAVVSPEKLREAAIRMATDAADGKLDWQARRVQKKAPLSLNANESMMSFSTAAAMVAAQAGKHYPAPHLMVETVKQASQLDRDGALAIENKGFTQLARSSEAAAQIGIFVADQVVKAKGKKQAKAATKKIEQAAVLGAGIMGGGIAYQSAVKGTPIVMKDIAPAALELGLKEASTILGKGMKRGKVDAAKMATTLNNIVPTMDYKAIEHADIVIEAVVENPKVKGIVLKETEAVVSDDAIICSNTSTISIDRLAEHLDKPERFCGMHFFNPVHKMPLVEVIRGEKTSEETINAVVAASLKMGKTPIVVNDCPGFFVNRVLFPYFAGFSKLVLDGADFVAVDKVMEKIFGWPMGPAYLSDVVGLDTCVHGSSVMAEGFPERMSQVDDDPVSLLYQAERYGQKNGKGFYNFGTDKRGKPTKVAAEAAYALFDAKSQPRRDFDKDEIVARMMIPMINETVRCLEEGIVASAAEADMALLYGVGFPPFRGGIFRYIETMGLANFVALADKYADQGPLYQVTDGMRDMAASGQSYFSQSA
jgi:3-hydroxyacyl-CoA dehydrogenase/enoyl-CoA hydratase/3-hydroxybutyryl-CoA epimerase/enoyl-CoA isomerase